MTLFGIPYRIHPSFFLIAALLGMTGGGDLLRLALWVALVLVGVTVHELGHGLTARAFGLAPAIQLHGMGGTTSWSEPRRVAALPRILITLAGPFAGFALGAILYAAYLALGAQGRLTPRLEDTLELGLWINVGWGILNLVPVLPLDGGRVVATALEAGLGGRGQKLAHVLSVGVALALAGLAFWSRWLFLGVLAGWMALLNFQALRGAGRAKDPGRLRGALQGAMDAVRRRDPAAARAARARLKGRPGTEEAALGELVEAWALALEGRREEAEGRLDRLPAGLAQASGLRAWLFLAMEDAEAARASFEQAGQGAPPDPGLVVALARLGRLDEAAERARSAGSAAVGPGYLHLLQLESWEAGRLALSAEAGRALFELTGDPSAGYNVACAEARQGRLPEAMGWLERVAGSDWLTAAQLREDEDLAGLRGRADFEALITRLDGGGAS